MILFSAQSGKAAFTSATAIVRGSTDSDSGDSDSDPPHSDVWFQLDSDDSDFDYIYFDFDSDHFDSTPILIPVCIWLFEYDSSVIPA